MLRLMLMSGEITLLETMKMTNWLVMTRHAASAVRGMCHQAALLSARAARAERRTNWIASNKLSNAVNIINIHTRVKPTSLLSMSNSLKMNLSICQGHIFTKFYNLVRT